MTQEEKNALVGGEALEQTLKELKGVMPEAATDEEITNIVKDYHHA